MSTPSRPAGCVLCLLYRPEQPPRRPDQPPVCDGDRRRLDRDLAAIAAMHQRLAEPGPVEHDRRWYRALDADGNPTGQIRRNDPVAALLPAAPVRPRSGQPIVSGTRTPGAPIDLDTLDLTAPARNGTVHDPHRDQTGHLPVATELDQWVRDWRDVLWPDASLPQPDVDALVWWLQAGLDDACTWHPAIDEFARDVRRLRGVLRGALGETDPRPQVLWGVTCRGCDEPQLVRHPGDTWIECDGCGRLYTETEYRDRLTEAAGRVAHNWPAQRAVEETA